MHFLPLECPVTWFSMVRNPVDWFVSRFRYVSKWLLKNLTEEKW